MWVEANSKIFTEKALLIDSIFCILILPKKKLPKNLFKCVWVRAT
jgi:hypothetical protein